MNNVYLEMAKKVIVDPQILSVVAAKRARQLALGARPMIKCDSENFLDVALLEIGSNLIGYEFEEKNAATTPGAEEFEAAFINATATDSDAAADAALAAALGSDEDTAPKAE